MKQTAVEFLEKELNELLVLFSDKWDKVNKAIEQAKEMEEQQRGYSEEDILKLVNALNKISQFSDIGNDFLAVVKIKSIAVDAINQFKNK